MPRRLWRVLLISTVVVLVKYPLVADGACCTSGQPTYVNNRLNFIGLPTCSDGPCKDEAAGYDYTRLTGKESDDPTSCCGLGGTFVYNPPADSTSTYPGPGYPMYPQINGTGRGCNATIAKWFCGITGQDVPTCADVDVKSNGTQTFNCSEGTYLNPDRLAYSLRISQEDCCKAVTCGEPDGLANPDPWPCNATEGYITKPGSSNLSPPSDAACCVRPTCDDSNGDGTAGDPWPCTTFGLLPRPGASQALNASNETCCIVATPMCKDVSPITNPGQNYQCDVSAGWQYDPAKENTTNPDAANPADCCLRPTCDDSNGDGTDGDPWPCTTFGLLPRPGASQALNASNKTCCIVATPTCKDISPITNPGQKYQCDESAGWRYDPVKENTTNPDPENPADCCLRLDCSTLAAEGANCTSGYTYNATKGSTTVTGNFTADCCDPTPRIPTCGDTAGDGSNTPWVCSAADGWLTNSSALTRTNPSNSVCCARQVCGDVEPFKDGLQRYNCSRSDLAYDPTADSSSPPTDDSCCKPAVFTCGNWDLTGAPFPCAAGTYINQAWLDVPSPSQSRCCTCNCTDGPFTIVKTGPEAVVVGEAFKYNLVVAFFGAASGVVVTDNLPAQLKPSPTLKATWVARSVAGAIYATGECQTAADTAADDPEPEFTCSLQSITCKPGDIVEIEVPVIAGTEATSSPVVNWAYVKDNLNRTANDNATTIIRDKPGVPFVLTKLSPGNVTAGQDFNFGITVTFLESVTGAVIMDDLPDGLTRGSAAATWVGYTAARVQRLSGSCNTSDSSPEFTCPLGPESFTWNLGDTVELLVPAVATGLITNNLQNVARIIDNKNRTLEDTAAVNVTKIDAALGFMIIKSSPGTIKVDEVANFRVNVVFFGKTTGVTVLDNLPAPLLPVAGNPPTWTATVGGTKSNGQCTITNATDSRVSCSFSSFTFNAGDSIDLKVPVRTSQPTIGTLTNWAIVTDDKGRSDNSSANATIVESNEGLFSISKVCPSSAPQNELFNCEITAMFTSRALNVRITDDLPSGLVPGGTAIWTGFNAQNVQTQQGVCIPNALANPEYVCDIGGPWNSGDRVLLKVPVIGTVPGAGFVNLANMTDSRNRTASDDAPVDIIAARTPFILQKTGPGTAYVNQPFTFRVSAYFVGTVVGAVITDDLPAGLLVPANTTQVAWTGSKANGGGTLTGVCLVTSNQSPEYRCDLGASTVWLYGDRVDVLIPAVAPAVGTNFVNNATIRDSQNRFASDTAAVSAIQVDVPRLLVNKYGPGSACEPNTPFFFTVAAGVYPGSPPVNPLTLVDELQTTDAKFVDPVPANCTKKTDQRMECWWDEPVGPSNTKLVKFYVIGVKPGTVVNNAIVNSPGVLTMNDTAEATICNCTKNSTNPPDVDKQGPGVPVKLGDVFQWTITADVPGANKPANMTLTDQLPADSGFVFTGLVEPVTLDCPTKQPNLVVCVLYPPFPQTVKIYSNATRAGLWRNFAEVRTLEGADNSSSTVIIEPPPSPSPSPVPSPSPQPPSSPSPSPSPSPGPFFVPTCGRFTLDGKSWIEAGGSCSPPNTYNPAQSANLSNSTAPNIGLPWSVICCTLTAQSNPDVNIKKSVSKTVFKGGETGTYTIVVTCDSLDTSALAVVVNDTVPAGLTPITDSWKVVNKNGQQTSDTCAFTNRLLVCNLGTMSFDSADPTQRKTITFEFTVQKVSVQTLIDNTGWVGCSNKFVGTQNTHSNCLGKNSTVTIEVNPDDPVIPPQNTVTVQAAGANACRNKIMGVSVTADPGLGTPTGVTVVTTCDNRVRVSSVVSPKNACRVVQGAVTCLFARLAKPQVIRFQVTGVTPGRYTCLARATVKGNSKDVNKATGSGTVLGSTDKLCAAQVDGGCCINPFTKNRQCLNKVTQDACAARNGTWRQSQTCSLTWCSDKEDPSVRGSCCNYPGTVFAACAVATQAECTGWGKKWLGANQCSMSTCPQPPVPPPPAANCQCQSCGAPGSQWPSGCCSGYYCGTSGNRWSGYRQVCMRSAATGWRAASTSTTAACSTAGRECGHSNGLRCCAGAELDCVLQSTGTAQCVDRSRCRIVGSTCKGMGECCGGLVCGTDGRCQVANCAPENSCRARDTACEARRALECEVTYVAAMGSPVTEQQSLAAKAAIEAAAAAGLDRPTP